MKSRDRDWALSRSIIHRWLLRATEIIHIGQAVLFYGGSVDYFHDMVFNYPTLAEAYKVAALDGLNKL